MDEQVKKRIDKKRIIITSVVLCIFIGVMIFLIVKFWPYLIGLLRDDEEVRNELIQILESKGKWAWLLLILCLMIQVIFAIIPNGAFEMIAGLFYGPWLGSIISLVGSTLGCIVVIILVRAFGKGFASLFVNLEDSKKLAFLRDEKRCLILLFGFLIIPGLPKDFVVFLVPFTSIKIWKFVLVNLFARAPATIISAVLGNSLMTGDFNLGLILMGTFALIGVLCLIFNKKIVAFFDKNNENNNVNSEKME